MVDSAVPQYKQDEGGLKRLKEGLVSQEHTLRSLSRRLAPPQGASCRIREVRSPEMGHAWELGHAQDAAVRAAYEKFADAQDIRGCKCMTRSALSAALKMLDMDMSHDDFDVENIMARIDIDSDESHHLRRVPLDVVQPVAIRDDAEGAQSRASHGLLPAQRVW